ERMQVDDAEDVVVPVLLARPVTNGAEVVSDVGWSVRLNATEHPWGGGWHRQAMLREPGQALDTPGNFCRVGPSHLLESELLPEVHTMFAAQPAWAKVLGAAGLAIAFVAGSSFGPHTSPARAGLTADLLPGVAPASATSRVVVTGPATAPVPPAPAHTVLSRPR